MTFSGATQAHTQYFAERGFAMPPPGFVCLSERETRSEVGIASASIRIEYFDIADKPTGHARYRLLDSTATSDHRKFTQKKGSGLRLYLPRLPVADKIKWRTIAKSKRHKIVFTEGEFKAQRAANESIACIGLGGVDCWRQQGAPLGDFAQFEWTGRPVELCFDSDQTRKPQVRRAVVRFADYLAGLGAVVVIRVLFDVTGTGNSGLDDVLTKGGVAAYELAPVYPVTSGFIANWRQEADHGANLPALPLQSITSAWLDAPLPAPAFLVDGYLPAGIVALGIGEGGVGKSTLFLQMAICVATGEKFLELATQCGRVAFVALEDPKDEIRRRVFRIFADVTDGLEPKGVEQMRRRLEKNLVVESLVGAQLHLIRAVQGTVEQNAAVLDHLRARLSARGPFSLLVLDNLARLHGGEENSNAVGTAAINAIESLRPALDADGAVLVVHHVGKAAATSRDRSAQAARGASGLTDAARSVLRLVPGEGGSCVLVHAKSNYTAQRPDIHLGRTPRGTFERTGGPPSNSADGYEARLGQLLVWDLKLGAPFSMASLTQNSTNRKAIFGATATRTQIEAFWKRAIERGDLQSVPTRGRGGGTRFRVARRQEVDSAAS